MKKSTLDLLACPICHRALSLRSQNDAASVSSGSLICSSCQKSFSIQNGIPHFIKADELQGFNRTFAHLYDWFSLIYAAFSRVGFFLLGTSESRARQELIDRLEPRGGKVLEVSIGPGVNLPYLVNSPLVSEVYGLDISIGQLNRCNSYIHRKGWDVDLFLANGEQLPFKDGCFDSVFHVGGINFFSEKQKAINEMIRVAKPNTHIIICDENERGAQWYEKFLPGFKRTFKGQRDTVVAPVDLVPPGMREVKLSNIWNGFMYCLEFTTP